jgi:flagellar hook protein FlgE
MSLFTTLRTGASGLGGAGLGLEVIGDNIANLNTTGFKRNRATFADMLPGAKGTMNGVQSVGRGVQTANIVTEFDSGSLQTTGSALDVAIAGVGWFKVKTDNQEFYTRDGSFMLDQDNYIVTAGGHRVQGYGAEQGVVSPVLGDIQLDAQSLPPRETTAVSLAANLIDPESPDDELTNALQVNAGNLDGQTISITELSAQTDHSSSITVYDSVGRPHDLVLVFEKVGQTGAITDWEYSVVVDGGEAEVGGVAGIDGMALEIASGTMQFNDGDLTVTANAFPGGWNWPGAAVFEPEINLEDMSYTGGDSFTVFSVDQDGYGLGALLDVSVDREGTIIGRYTNGEQQALAQFALATFESEAGLNRIGGNLYTATLASGSAAISGAGTGTRGEMVGFAIEGSNVNLESEFVNMIQMQRTYQSSAKVVSTVDETLQALVNIV